MRKSIKLTYLSLHYIKDLSLVLQLFIIPFLYYFFYTSQNVVYNVSQIEFRWLLSLFILFIIYVSAMITLYKIENNRYTHKFWLEIKDGRYKPTVLAGCLFGFLTLNLAIFVVFSVYSMSFYQNTLMIYSYYPFLIIVHLDIFILTLYILLKLNFIEHKRYMPLIQLFQSDQKEKGHIIKKPII